MRTKPMNPSAIARGTLFALTAVVLTATGCKQAPLCPTLDGCAGPLSGDWSLVPGNPFCTTCSEDLYVVPPDTRLPLADLPPARQPLPEPVLFDWCQLLVTGSGDIVARPPPALFLGVTPVGRANIHYDEATLSYAVTTTRTAQYSLDFPAFCMRAFGARDMGPGNDVCVQLQADLRKKMPKKYKNITCEANKLDPPDAFGCLCGVEVYDLQESRGRFITQTDSTILHLPGNNFPETATYCSQSDTLQLTGTDGEYLFDRLGLRTMSLAKIAPPNCADGMQGPGEDGIDCGPACPILCGQINCQDMMQGLGEDGVDCGPNCPMACP
jgi:hypothetical protein